MKKGSIIQPFRIRSKDTIPKSTVLSNSIKPDYILADFIDENGTCKKCRQNHSYNPTYDDVKSSIDIILELFKRSKFLELY